MDIKDNKEILYLIEISEKLLKGELQKIKMD
jgi:hypothetical protein